MMVYNFFLIILLSLLYINLIKAQNLLNISPREKIYQYLNEKGCKNKLLNKMLLHTLYGREQGISYPMLRDMIIKHVYQIDEREVYKCYQILIDKFVLETGYRRFLGY